MTVDGVPAGRYVIRRVGERYEVFDTVTSLTRGRGDSPAECQRLLVWLEQEDRDQAERASAKPRSAPDPGWLPAALAAIEAEDAAAAGRVEGAG